MKKPTFEDLDIMVRTVWGEARGESHEGKVAVAHVILNRANAAEKAGAPKMYGDGSIKSACLFPKQFSCWNKNDRNYNLIQELYVDDEYYIKCLKACNEALSKPETDKTGKANHYWSRRMLKPPVWAEGKEYITIGNHNFIKL